MLIIMAFSSLLAAASELPEVISQIKDKYRVPGLVATYVELRKQPQIVASGIRKSGYPQLIEKDDKFPLGSNGKAMTATLVATFIDEGKLNWADTLEKLLPDFELHEDFKKVTLEMLMAHRSGLPANQKWDDYLRWSQLETTEGRIIMAKTLLKQAPEKKAGEWNYSNAGYITLGLILQKISGKTWEMLIHERIFSALDMKTCGFGPTTDGKDVEPLQPWGHLYAEEKLHPSQTDNAPFYGPAGGINCSVADWSKFLTMQLEGYLGESTFLKTDTFKKLFTPYPKWDDRLYTYGAWGMGSRDWAGGTIFGHDGDNVRNYSSAWLIPSKRSFIMSNTNVSSKIGGEAVYYAMDELMIYFYGKPRTP
jgi:CubicO group peptidase (beta-lactamase class C family)